MQLEYAHLCLSKGELTILCFSSAAKFSRSKTISFFIFYPRMIPGGLREACGRAEPMPGRRSVRKSRAQPPSGAPQSRNASHDASASSRGRHLARRCHRCFLRGYAGFPSSCLLSASEAFCFFRKSDKAVAILLRLLMGGLAVVDDRGSLGKLVSSIVNKSLSFATTACAVSSS